MTLLDCGMGTMVARGYSPLQVHRVCIKAGSQVITTSTFMANRFSDDDVLKHNQEAVAEAMEAKEGHPSVLIAGSIGPTTENLHTRKVGEFIEAYSEQVQALKGVDVFLVETVTDPVIAALAVRCCKEADPSVPVWVSLAPSVSPAVAMAALMPLPLQAIGYNCGSGPQESAPLLKTLSSLTSIPLIWYPSAGLPDENGRYPYGPKHWTQIVADTVKSVPVRYVGGCCGTTPKYIASLKAALS